MRCFPCVLRRGRKTSPHTPFRRLVTSWGEGSFTRLLATFVQLWNVRNSMTRKCMFPIVAPGVLVLTMSQISSDILCYPDRCSCRPWQEPVSCQVPRSWESTGAGVHCFASLTSGIFASCAMNSCTIHPRRELDVARCSTFRLTEPHFPRVSGSTVWRSTSPSHTHRRWTRVCCAGPPAGPAGTNAMHDCSC